MPTLSGRHTQAASGRELNYWATFDMVPGGVTYSAVIREGRQLLATPDFTFGTPRPAPAPEDVVRRHLVAYVDAMPCGALKAPERVPARAC